MNNERNNTTAGGIGFCGLLAVAFIVLKLTGVINWSWSSMIWTSAISSITLPIAAVTSQPACARLILQMALVSSAISSTAMSICAGAP